MDTAAIEAIALSVRTLTIDAVQAANNGHPGMPMGMAELGALLYGEVMRHDPADPSWPDRDRFVLSAGHGSMFLYSLFHLAGYDLSLEDIKQFRQLGSRTPGHPEYGYTPGVETTTGPLGQGFCNAVGMAIAEQMAAARFNTDQHTIVDHYTYCIAGDGCLMEGVSGEAASLAGHLALGKLIVFYDSNRISIEGSTDLAFTEDVAKRFAAFGWHVQHGDAYDVDKMRSMIASAQQAGDQPSLIVLDSLIGKGSPNKAGTHGVHGAALGPEEVVLTKKQLGVDPDSQFYIDPAAPAFFADYRTKLAAAHAEWAKRFEAWSEANPGLIAAWQEAFEDGYRAVLGDIGLPEYEVGAAVPTRKASGQTIQAIAKMLPNFVGGSADLAPSNNTAMPEYGSFTKDNRSGRTIHYGVREHAMASISNGLALHGGFRPFCATFMVFSDYLRPAFRLSCLMNVPVIYVFTHDSVYLGMDGPTHQPIEHLAALRAIPNSRVLRPADADETTEAWIMALEHDGPTALVLTRQNVPVLEKASADWRSAMRQGAYVVVDTPAPELVIVATGSEVWLARDAAAASGRKVRIVSMPSRELFEAQDADYQATLLPPGVPVMVIEAGVAQGWEQIAGSRDNVLSIDRFGESGAGDAVAAELGLSVANATERIKALLG